VRCLVNKHNPEDHLNYFLMAHRHQFEDILSIAPFTAALQTTADTQTSPAPSSMMLCKAVNPDYS
jgi:hypothetical protein